MRDDLKTLERGLRVLSELAHSDKLLGPRELARRVGIARSAVQRSLATLKTHGFVRQDPVSRLYALGYAARALAETIAAKDQLVLAGRGPMEKLCAVADETICLNVRDDTWRIPLFQVESAQTLRYSVKVGQRYPLYAGAASKVLLAFLPETELMRLRPELEQRWKRLTASTPKSWRDMERSLAEVAARGYAITHGETVPEAVGIAAPIYDGAARVVASIGIYGPNFRLPRARIVALVPRVMEAANVISKSLGANPARLKDPVKSRILN